MIHVEQWRKINGKNNDLVCEKYENEKAEPSIANLIKLAHLFNVSVDTLIGNDAEIVDLTVLDEDRKYIVKKVARELNDVEVGQIIGVMKTFK